MNKQVKNRILPILMAIVMVISLLPVLGGAAKAADAPKELEELTTTGTKTLRDGVTYYITGDVTINSGKTNTNGLVVANNATVTICIPVDTTLTVYGKNGSGTTGGGAAILLPEGATLIVVGGGKLVAEGGDAGNGASGDAGKESMIHDDTDGRYGSTFGYSTGWRAGGGGTGGTGGGGAGAGIGTNGGAGGSGYGRGGLTKTEVGDDAAKLRDGSYTGGGGSDGKSGDSAETAGTFMCAAGIDLTGVKGGNAGSRGSGGGRGTDGRDGDQGDARGIAGGAGGGGGGGGHAGAAIGTGGGGGGQGGGGGTAGYIWSGYNVGGGGGGGGGGATGGLGGTCGNDGVIDDTGLDCENDRTGSVTLLGPSYDGSAGNSNSGGSGGSGAKRKIISDDDVESTGQGGQGGSGGSAGAEATSNGADKYIILTDGEMDNWDVTLDWTGESEGSDSSFGFTEGQQTLSFEINALNWGAASGKNDGNHKLYYVLCDENGNPVLDSEGNEIRGELEIDESASGAGFSGAQPVEVTLPEGLGAGNYQLNIYATDSDGDIAMNTSFDVDIEPKPMDEDDVTVSFDDAEIALNPPVFNGGEIKPTIDLEYDGKKLVEGVDYDLVYSDDKNPDKAVNAGEGKVTVVFKGDYSGTIEKTFPIEPKPLEKKDITSTLVPVMDGDTLTFTGGIKWGNTELVPGVDYDIVMTPDEQDPTKADISIEFKGNYKNIVGEDSMPVPLVFEDQTVRTILKENLFDFAVDDIVYTGGRIKPTVTPSNENMVEGKHYTVRYENNVGAGTGKIIITGIAENGFAGTIEKTFTIAKADQTAPDVSRLAVVDETAQNKKDGTIVGVSNKMEYSADDGNTWKPIYSNKITGLAPGDYQIRYKADDNRNESDPVTLTITGSTETLTVMFDLNGATGDAISEQTGFAYGDKGTVAPSAPTYEGHAFLGWTLADGTAWTFGDNGSPVTDNITLYAKWVQTGFDVSGVIYTNETMTSGASGAVIKAMQGNLVYQEVTAGANGTYQLTNVPAGTYNLVVEHDGKTVTSLVNVAEDGSVEPITLPAEKAISTVTVAPGTSNIVVGGLNEQANAALEKAGKENRGKSIISVAVDMSVETKLSEDVDEEVKGEIEKQAAAQSENLTFFDIDITQTTVISYRGNQTTESAPVRETEGLLTFIIPFDTEGKISFKVFRHHENDNGEKVVHALITKVNEAGEYIEVGEGELIVHARFFSTYAIGYSKTRNDLGIGSFGNAVTGPAPENGAVILNTKNPAVGSTVTVTVTPDEGYELEKLIITDSEGNVIEVTDNGDGTFSFTMPAGEVAVEAVFCVAGTRCSRDDTCPISAFGDAKVTAWYHDGVHYCIDNGLMNGVSGTQFAPNGTTTRAQIVTILWRLEGEPGVNYAMGFTDVAANKWYTEAVRWAASENIVGGYSATSFGPNDAITREQFAAILWRYCRYKGIDVSVGEETNILSYSDAFDIHSWAMPAMQWACGAGVIGGIADGNSMMLDPTGTATRAQVATMLQRFCTEITEP